jgi:signal transduction histidine kinase
LAPLQTIEPVSAVSAVTRRLLDFSRQEATLLEVFDAAAALAEMEPVLRQLLGPQVTLEPALEGPARIRFDRAQLELIMLTLASNAGHAMPGGGRFGLSLRCLPDDAGGQVLIEATDTGTGMDAQALARCFEPFFTTKPAGQGTGLGLAVADNLVNAAGGRMEAEGAPGQGCTFRIVLPRQRGPE